MRNSPEVRIIRSGSGISGSYSRQAMVRSVILSAEIPEFTTALTASTISARPP